ncbi:DUF1045 domain-containing protein [Agrobacterium sp. a22-2]|uniref:DUF1045 domain-containing protein n=1 Tax=Agrobacterium sp. a22-2 TaxID=2283840 RepID=UPI0014451F37|nr:DUF1045 domain-containing protein [Agrobacterium sp. a22-2]NKN35775.1 DUF1045 domain-containing protein [Agrobacterium sp. a22-2]
MRYAISFTTPAGDPLSFAAASWLGRSVYSGEPVDHPAIRGLGLHEIAFHTALPRRYGFHATLKAPFRMDPERAEASLLRDMMRFAGTLEPFDLPKLEVARLGDFFGLMPTMPCPSLDYLAAAVVQEFDAYRAPLTEAEIERMAPERLTAPQFANLYRWGHPYAMDEFRFHMPLTGPLSGRDVERFGTALKDYFGPLLSERVTVNNLALFFEREPGAPFQVHSLHPMGRVSARKIA